MRSQLNKLVLLLLIALGLTIFFMCSTPKETAHNSVLENRAEKATYTKEDTGIVFVIMKIYSDSITHSNKVVVKDKIYASGHVKSHPMAVANPESYLTCVLYNGDLLLDSVRLNHPLHRRVEYFEEGGKGAIKEINQKEGEFSVRFQLKGKANTVKVFETFNRSKPKELITVQL